MNYRKTLFLLLAFTVSQCFAQSKSEKRKTWIGVNAADLIIKDDVLMPTITLDWNVAGNHHIRLQAGYTSFNSSTNSDASTQMPFNNIKQDTTINNSPFSSSEFGGRLGYYQSTSMGDKFDFFYGLDFVYQQKKSEYSADFNVVQDFGSGNTNFFDIQEKTKSSTVGYGVSPLAGLRYKVSEKISLSYEMQVLYMARTHDTDVSRKSIQTSSFNTNVFIQDSHRTVGTTDDLTRILPMSGLYLYILL